MSSRHAFAGCVVATLLLAACGSWTEPSGWAEALAFEARTKSSPAEVQDLMNDLHEAAGIEADTAEEISQRNRDTYELLLSYHQDGGQTVEAQVECMIDTIEAEGLDIVSAGEQCHDEWRARFG